MPAATKRTLTKRRLPTTGNSELPVWSPMVKPAKDNSDYNNAAATPVDKPLTDKQRQFVKEWAAGESITAASIRAGYETATIGYRMVRMPNILAAYQLEKDKYESASQMSRAKIMAQFSEAYDMAKLISDPHAMVSATREAAKMLGYYEPVKRKLDITITGNGRTRELSAMSNEDLAKLLDDMPAEQGALVHDLRDVIEDAIVRDEEEQDVDH